MLQEGKPRFEHHLKKYLVKMKHNLYVNPNDPLYYQKTLQYLDPHCPASHFHLGRNYEKSGEYEKAAFHYKQAAAKPSSPYWYEAREGLTRLISHQQANHPPIRPTAPGKNSRLSKSVIISLLLVNLLLLVLLLKVTLGGTPSSLFSSTSEHEQFPVSLGSSWFGHASDNSSLPIWEELSEYGTSYIATNMVRTALAFYQEETGGFPLRVDQLLGDYPNNYLHFIPDEPFSQSQIIVENWDGTGGWVYNPSGNSMEERFYPNVPEFQEAKMPYTPTEIWINKAQYKLYLFVGPYLLLEQPVGLGKNDSTPLGSFIVQERVWEPKSHVKGVYGTAGLGMGDIAIHGTTNPESINNNRSLGCIRLKNKDIEQLFAYVPKGTPVYIESESSLDWKPKPEVITLAYPPVSPAQAPNHHQSSDRIFEWLG